jgi:hypothetical protein
VTNIGRRAIAKSDAEGKKYAFVVLVAPSESSMNTQVKPGAMVFVGHD